MLWLRRLLGVSLLLVPAIRADAKPEVLNRLTQSIQAGTGGEKARFLLCNPEAVLFFADGHQTPELITDDRAWEEILHEEIEPRGAQLPALPEELSAAGRKSIHGSKSDFRSYSREFAEESRRYARLVVGAAPDDGRRYRDASEALSNRARDNSLRLARRSLELIATRLSEPDRRLFFAWLQRAKHELVIGTVDFTKVRVYQLQECGSIQRP